MGPWQGAAGPYGETRLHLYLPAQIEVATSVCTGGSNMPPAYCDLIFRVSHSKDKSRESKCSFGFYGPSGETRTRGILVPKNSGNFFLILCAPFWHLLFQKSCSLKLSSPLSPSAPNPVMVKYVVKPRFCDRTGACKLGFLGIVVLREIILAQLP